MFWVHFFSIGCHSKNDKKISLKPTPNSHKCSKFSVKESWDNLSQSILKLFKHKWTQLIKKFDPFQEIPVQSNKAVLAYVQQSCFSVLQRATSTPWTSDIFRTSFFAPHWFYASHKWKREIHSIGNATFLLRLDIRKSYRKSNFLKLVLRPFKTFLGLNFKA